MAAKVSLIYVLLLSRVDLHVVILSVDAADGNVVRFEFGSYIHLFCMLVALIEDRLAEFSVLVCF